MTIEEFDKTKFNSLMHIKHDGIINGICSVDFKEKLIAFKVDNDEDLHWARCENCELINLEKLKADINDIDNYFNNLKK